MALAITKAEDTATGEKADTAAGKEGAKVEKGAPLAGKKGKVADSVKGGTARERVDSVTGPQEAATAAGKAVPGPGREDTAAGKEEKGAPLAAEKGEREAATGLGKAGKNVHLAEDTARGERETGAPLVEENAESTVIGLQAAASTEKEGAKAEKGVLSEERGARSKAAGKAESGAPLVAEKEGKVDSAQGKEGRGARLAASEGKGAKGAPLAEKAQAKEGLTAPNS